MNSILHAFIVGIGATAVTDLWALTRRRWFKLPLPDYGLVGRWFAHMLGGRFRHEAISKAAPVMGERALGWLMHYVIGVCFAALLAMMWRDWPQQPTLGPALAVGFGTVAAPFLLMQPGMGAGVAASRTARPGFNRLQSLITHTVFGLGLYAAGWAAQRLF